MTLNAMLHRNSHPFILTLLALLPACGASDGDSTPTTASSATDASSGAGPATDGASTTGGGTSTGTTGEAATETDAPPTTSTTGTTADTDSDGETGDACELSTRAPAPYYSGNASFAWMAPVDELCTVVTSDATPGGLELRMDCPNHAAQNAGEQVELSLQSGPMPAKVPQVGETLHVFYQLGGDYVPRPGLLFLRRDDQLIYTVVNGFFVFQDDVKNANKHSLPLRFDQKAGVCPLVNNPLWQGSEMGFVCERESPAQMEVIGDGPPLLLYEDMSGEVQVGGLTYALDVRLARRGENCGELPAVARQTLAAALVAP